MLEIKITGKPGEGKSTLLHFIGKCLKLRRVNVKVVDEDHLNPVQPEGWVGEEPDDREVLLQVDRLNEVP